MCLDKAYTEFSYVCFVFKYLLLQLLVSLFSRFALLQMFLKDCLFTLTFSELSWVYQFQIIYECCAWCYSVLFLNCVYMLNGWLTWFCDDQMFLQGDFLELKFSITLLLRLGKTCRPLVALKISLTSFHFMIMKFLPQRNILKFSFRAVTKSLIFRVIPKMH